VKAFVKMLRIVTDVEGAPAHPEHRSRQSLSRLWRSRRPALAVLGVGSLALVPVLVLPVTSQAASLSSLQARASQLQQEIAAAGVQISALGQRYDQAQNELASIQNQITVTKGKITTDEDRVSLDKVHLRTAAINTYVTDGTAGMNPLFSGNQKSYAAQQEYGQVAAGNLNVDVADLHTAAIALNSEKAQLITQQASAQSAVNAAYSAEASAHAQQATLDAELSQVKGQVGLLEQQDQAAANSRENSETEAELAGGASFPPPPPNSAGGRAVAAAETQLGVPYVWGAESPGVGFDCSGLTAWAWGQAGVGLPHYSGAQMADSAPVPVSDLEAGDLLFYGPGGSDHVAMYVGGGEMIEAPETGEVVHITPLRLGDGFVGAGRP
jgi:peptidoglycan DL-endopeptidase CwlO